MEHSAQAWQELASAGLRVHVDGDRGRIRFPADRVILSWLVAGFVVLSGAVLALGLLAGFGLSSALVLAAAVLVAGLALTLAKRRWWAPFDVTVDLSTGDVRIPPHGTVLVCAGHFNARDVGRAGVDWRRAHGSPAVAGAPIVYLAFTLRNASTRADTPALWMDRLDATRARAFVLWFYRHVIPTADELGSVDARPSERQADT